MRSEAHIVLRPPTHSDWQSWLALRRTALPQSTDDEHFGAMRRALHDPNRHLCLIAGKANDSPVAVMQCHLDGTQTAHVDVLYVAPQARGQGIAGALIERMDERLRAMEIRSLVLDVTAEDLDAQNYAARLGFESPTRIMRYQHSVLLAEDLNHRDSEHVELTLGAQALVTDVSIDATPEPVIARRTIVNVVLGVLAAISVVNTDIFSTQLVPGVLLPLVDLLLLVYFIGVGLSWRYAKRSDSRERMGDLFTSDKEA